MSKLLRPLLFSVCVVCCVTPCLAQDKQAVEDEEVSKDEFLARLEEDSQDSSYVYNPKGKKDPFRSFDFSPKQENGVTSGDTPLEQFAYDELKVTAILQGFDDPKAIIEDPDGKGHTVSVGSKVGLLGGTIVKIDEKKLSVLETVVEFTGEKTTRTIEMYMR